MAPCSNAVIELGCKILVQGVDRALVCVSPCLLGDMRVIRDDTGGHDVTDDAVFVTHVYRMSVSFRTQGKS